MARLDGTGLDGQDAQGRWELRVYGVYYGSVGDITGLRVKCRP